MRRLLPSLALMLTSTVLPLEACRYSIRDTGFVDLGLGAYRLELAPGIVSGDVAAFFRQAAEGALLDSNVEFAAGTEPASGGAGLHITDATGRRLELVKASSLPRQREEVMRLMESVATSPRREDIVREALRSFAVLVLVEGTNASANRQTRETLDAAVRAVERLMPGMPKPVAIPPQRVVVPVSEQSGEALLLWGLGLDPAPAADPRLALVYGRGRRLGVPLEGPMITRTAVQERLVMIGQDCECDLDRAWLKGPVIPGRWDRELQQIAARTLGFDPENPMVRTEVSRIVLRGEGDRTRQSRPASALALGYTEESVDGGGEENAVAGLAEDSASTNSQAPAVTTPGKSPPRKPDTAGASSLWVVVLGGLAATIVAGVWVGRRGTRNL
jgi:hypothetical protein